MRSSKSWNNPLQKPEQKSDYFVKTQEIVTIGYWDGYDWCITQSAGEYQSCNYTFESIGYEVLGWMEIQYPEP
jgi:hypothetical protein